MGRVAEQLAAQKAPLSLTKYRVDNGISKTPTIKARFLGITNDLSSSVHMGGWHGPAKTRIIEGNYLCPIGQITHRWSLEILPDGYCEIPDTEYNRRRLRAQIVPHTVKGKAGRLKQMPNGMVGVVDEKEWSKEEGPCWQLLDSVDLEKSAPINDIGVEDKNPMEDVLKENEALKEQLKELESTRQAKRGRKPKDLTSPPPME